MNIPKQLRAGDSIQWSESPFNDAQFGSIDSATWTLTVAIRGGVSEDVVGTPVASRGWDFEVEPDITAAFPVGIVYWQAYAEKAGDRVTVGSGQIRVLANITAAGSNFDGRSQAVKDLEAVQAAMRAMISGGAIQDYTIGNRSVRKMTLADLIVLENKLKRDVAEESVTDSIANGLGNPRNLFVRFQ